MILISIGGATSSGKSNLAKIAFDYLIKKKLKVEIINCDCRQIYTGLSISSGVDKQADMGVSFIGKFNLKDRISVVDYLKEFINEINSHKNTLDAVILVGGTGMYTKVITDRYKLTETKPGFQEDFDQLSSMLESKSKNELQNILDNIDPKTFERLNNSDKNNPRRLKNFILKSLGSKKSWYNFLQAPKFTKTIKLWAQINGAQNSTKIGENLKNRIKNGMVEEIISLIHIYGQERVKELGLGYTYGVDLFNKKINLEEWEEFTLRSEIQYSKRQVTWLKQQDSIIIDSSKALLLSIDTLL